MAAVRINARSPVDPSRPTETKLKSLSDLNASNFQAWKKSPSGLSATGFGKIGPTEGQAEALANLQREKRARDGR